MMDVKKTTFTVLKEELKAVSNVAWPLTKALMESVLKVSQCLELAYSENSDFVVKWFD